MMDIFLIAVALAMDSVAVSIASGSKYKNINLSTALKIAFFMAIFQGIMPLIGYFIGTSFYNFIDSFDHFISFIILVYLAYKMIKEARENEFENELNNLKTKTLFILAFATSIDALAVGITFSFEEIDILYALSLIVLVTFILCIIGVFLGKKLGGFLESRAEYLGAFILIFLGFKILLEGLNLI